MNSCKHLSPCQRLKVSIQKPFSHHALNDFNSIRIQGFR